MKHNAPPETCLAVIPLGTANDLATSLTIRDDNLIQAMKTAVRGAVPGTTILSQIVSHPPCRASSQPLHRQLLPNVLRHGLLHRTTMLRRNQLACIVTCVCVLPSGLAKPIDVAKANDKYFLNMASGGFGTEAAKQTDSGLKEKVGGAAYLITGEHAQVLAPCLHAVPAPCSIENRLHRLVSLHFSLRR